MATDVKSVAFQAQAYALAPKLPAAREQFYAACLQLEAIKAHVQVAVTTFFVFFFFLPQLCFLAWEVNNTGIVTWLAMTCRSASPLFFLVDLFLCVRLPRRYIV